MQGTDQIEEDGAGDKASASALVEIHVDALQLKIAIANVCSRGIDTMLLQNHLKQAIMLNHLLLSYTRE